MAHFIKLTDAENDNLPVYANINNITQFFKSGAGSVVVLTSLKEEGYSDFFITKETPEQILALIAEAQGGEVMSDDKDYAFDDAFEAAARDEYESVSVDRAKHTCAYLEDLVSEDEEIASFTVAEIIKHLNLRI